MTAPDPYRCCICERAFPVVSLAEWCAAKHEQETAP